MTISKALLPTSLCAVDFKSQLEAWGVPARLIVNADGSYSRYVVFDGSALTPLQVKNLDATHSPIYCKIDVFDVRFIEEIKDEI